MIGFQRELVGRLAFAASSLALAGGALGCEQPTSAQAPVQEPKVGVVPQAGLAEDCGLVCAADGIAEGNAHISGVASVDAFFQSVVNFQAKADGLSASINAELDGIRADFGLEAGADLEAGLQGEFDTYLEGGLKVDYEPAKCAVDAKATLQAQANCDVDVDPGMAMIACKGSCEVEASADVMCEGSATLQCTVTAPSVACEGTCQGSCEVELTAAAACDGTCTGSCSGNCSAYSDSGATQCAGKCDGMCMGSCKAELAAGASCSGKCEGECTVEKPSGGCEGGVRASCKAEANAMVMCSGSCDGDIEPPSAKAECQASAKAEAKLNVECTPPRVAIDYELKAGADAMGQARFVAAVKNLQVRLPLLLAAIAKAEGVADAGVSLAADAGGTLTTAIQASVDGEANLRAKIGLGCALLELPKVADALTDSTGRLTASLSASAKLTAVLGG